MNREDTKKIITMLSAVYVTEFSKKSDDALKQMIDVWTMLLADEDANKIAVVTKTYLKTNVSPFCPTPAMLIDLTYELFEPKGMTEQEAWNILFRALSNSSYKAKETYDGLPEEIKPLCSPSQLREWGMMDIGTLNSVVASNFMRSFKVREKSRKEYDRLPKETKELIQGRNTGIDDKELIDLKKQFKSIE